jgi:hypothetical protein
MIKRTLAPALSALALVALAGCAEIPSDQFDRPGTWQPTGVNDANLRAMLVNPNDMVVGQAARGSSGILANASVTRVLTDNVKPLPRVTTGSNAGQSDTAQSGGGAATTGLGAAGGGQ